MLIAAIVFYFISIVAQQLEERKYTEKQAQLTIEQNLISKERNFETLVKNKSFVDDIIKNNESINNDYGVNLYKLVGDSLELVAWHNIIFNDSSIKKIVADTSYFIANEIGYFECRAKKIQHAEAIYFAVGYLPVKYNLSVAQHTQYTNHALYKYYNIEVSKQTTLPVKNIDKRVLFYLQKIQTENKVSYGVLSILTRVLSILLFCFYIHFITRFAAKKHGFNKGFALLIAILALLRCITYFAKIPFDFSNLALFDPTIFASNFLHPSLGDLLTNLLLLFWLISFYEGHQDFYTAKSTNKSKLSLIYLLLIVFISFIFIDVIKSLVIDSKIPFDVGHFFSLNIFTAVAFITICLAVINYLKLATFFYRKVIETKMHIALQVLIVLVTGIAGTFIESYFTKYNIGFIASIVVWLVVFILLLFLFETKPYFLTKRNTIISLYWILFFTTSTAAIIIFFENKLEIEQRKQLAEKIYLERNNEENLLLSDYESNEYPYAIYQNGKLKEKNGNYFFYKHQSPVNNGFQVIEEKNASKLIYQINENNAVVVIKETKDFINFITLFAYLFFSFLIIVFLLFIIINLSINASQFLYGIKENFYSIDAQIKTTVLLLSAVSFLIIGLISIYFYTEKFKQTNDEKIINVLNTIEQIGYFTSITDTSIQATIDDISQKNNLLLSAYDTKGKLIAVAHNKLFKNTLVAQQINYTAYQSIFQQHETLFKQDEKSFGKTLHGFYKPFFNESGEIIGCINIPDVNYQATLKQDLSGFIATLININAFIFLLATAIAFIITNRITASFALIKNKMKAVKWQTENDEIVWTRNDEIGALVNEYNAMVRKLDTTAKAFAQSQKEMAWKEMAKQVAHEIKNPLTPMKLSIQYLQNKIDDDAPNIKELSKTVAHTLIEQINQLSNIANDFSQFANIGTANAEKIDLNEIVKSVVTLFSINENVCINTEYIIGENLIFADKIQITRLFNNIIKNAIEAPNTNSIITINIKAEIRKHNIIISVADNGTGIPVDLQPKIFTINFTTKNSGTGLGLAICKGIVENANGKIWFDTAEKGTTFFIELPLA